MADCPLAAVLSTAAVRLDEPDLVRLAEGLTSPVRVRVRGRPGAGVATTARALRAAGVLVCGPDEEPEVDVCVLADPLAAGDGTPDLLVLDKADLPESAAVFGIGKAAGIPAVTLPAPAAAVDAVRSAIDRAAAPARYRRIEKVLAELSGRAAGPGGARIADLLAGDDVVLSRMLAAAEVLRVAGLPVPSVPADPLAAAIRWQRYCRGPVSDLHRACGADLCRGALRLWDRRPPTARPVAPVRAATGRGGLRTSRIEAGAAVRAGCAALRAELQAVVQTTGRAAEFVEQARLRVGEVAADLDAEIEVRLLPAVTGPTDPLPLPEEPPLRAAALESRLAALLGLTFGAGAALTLGRMLAELVPRWSVAVAVGCAALGLTLGLWVVRARRVLSERAAADRWVLEVTAALRSALEDRVSAHFLAAEAMLPESAPFRGSGRQ